MNRVIIRPPKVSLVDFISDFNYVPSLLRQAKHEPMPTLYDVKQLTALYGILPFGSYEEIERTFYRRYCLLGSEKVHETAPQIKGLLICGPRGCGKHMLLHAICNELGANLFDITPQNIFENYQGKEGIKMLMHLCSKVSATFRASICQTCSYRRMKTCCCCSR
jgi:IQ and AAA domain-containing protein